MKMLTKTILVEGRNRELLFYRLKRNSISAYKIKILDEKRMKITVSYKDAAKFFAICKNMWYNKTIKIGGLGAPIYVAVKRFLVSMGVLLFIIGAYLGDNVFLGTIYSGDAIYYRAETEEIFSQLGVTKFSLFNDVILNKAEEQLSSAENIGFITITKNGNRAEVKIKSLQQSPQGIKALYSPLVAEEDMTIVKIIVYSGTALVNKGAYVRAGETICGAYAMVGDKQSPCPLLAAVISECCFTYDYESAFPADEATQSRAVAAAKLMLGDYEVRSYKCEKTGENIVRVSLYYLKTLCGG